MVCSIDYCNSICCSNQIITTVTRLRILGIIIPYIIGLLWLCVAYSQYKKILDLYNESAISVVPSRWEEPFGRVALEASSRGCALIISNKGGLTEAITNGIVIKKLNSTSLYNAIKKIIENPSLMKKLQRDSLKNFSLTNKNTALKIDNYRSQMLKF